MRWIYFSPHFDDAILSCGGLIWQQAASGMPVEIWTICAGDPPVGELSPFAEMLHRQWRSGSASETVALRRVEDRIAARRVSAVTQHFSIPDCIYRRSKTGDALYSKSVFVRVRKSEFELVDEIAKMLKARIKPQDTLVCPLAIGGHVDHVITRRAVEKLGRKGLYYADIPYYLNYPNKLKYRAKGLNAVHNAVEAEALHPWQNAIADYASQMSGLFKSDADMRARMEEYWSRTRGINLWKVV
jgi:LmbE family N-acetylglucosaminyl deacetylase